MVGIKCGGSYCEKCKKCITPPRYRKNPIPEWWTICEECKENVLQVYFFPREDAIRTTFKVQFQDIPKLIQELKDAYERSEFTKNKN